MRAARQQHAQQLRNSNDLPDKGSALSFPRDTYPMTDDYFAFVPGQNNLHKQGSQVYTDQEFGKMHRKNSQQTPQPNDVPWHLYSQRHDDGIVRQIPDDEEKPAAELKLGNSEKTKSCFRDVAELF